MTDLNLNQESPLRVESLESRDTPAGNVSVFLSGGQLFAYGDSGDNQFTVQQTPAGDIYVIGGAGTTVNGQGTLYVGRGFVNGLQMVGGGGSDQMAVTGLYTNGPVAVYGGASSDGISLNGVTAGSLTVDAGGGSDVVVTNGVQVFGFADVSGGADFDTLLYGGLTAGGGVAFRDFEAAS